MQELKILLLKIIYLNNFLQILILKLKLLSLKTEMT